MPTTEAVQIIVSRKEKAEETVAPPHLLVYGWIYVFFAVLTVLALYVMFTFPQSDM